MDLNQYIKQSYKRPNRQILESLGANERLIEYLMETPGNTNWQVVNSIGEGESEIELPYTFRCEKVDFEGDGNTYSYWTIPEKEKWINTIDSINGGGNIIGTTFNLKGQEFEVSLASDQLDLTIMKDTEETDGMYAGARGYQFRTWHEESASYIAMQYLPAYEFTKGCIIIISSEFNACDEVNIVLDIQEGYFIDVKFQQETETVEKQSFMIEKDRPFYISDIGQSVTDGVNVYTVNDTITPTSDMELTIIS